MLPVVQIQDIIQRSTLIGIGVRVDIAFKIHSAPTAGGGHMIDRFLQQAGVGARDGSAGLHRLRLSEAANDHGIDRRKDMLSVEDAHGQVCDGLRESKTGTQPHHRKGHALHGIHGVSPSIDLLVCIADDQPHAGLTKNDIQHGGRSILCLIEEDVIIGKLRCRQLEFLEIEIMDHGRLSAIHHRQETSGEMLDLGIVSRHKFAGRVFRHDVQIVERRNLCHRTVTEILGETIDMIGQHETQMPFAGAGDAQQFGEFMDLVTGAHIALTQVTRVAIGQGMGGFDIHRGQSRLGESSPGLLPHRAVEGQVEDPGTRRPRTGIL